MINDIKYNLKNYTLDFSDEQLKQFRSDISDLYSLLKDVFDRPRRSPLPYNSFIDYKVKQQRKYHRPDEFYHFTFNNIEVHIARRIKKYFSVAVHGVTINDTVFRLLGNSDNYLSNDERDFSCGYAYYGRFPLSKFNECVETYCKVVACIVFDYFGLDVSKLYKQLEFIF